MGERFTPENHIELPIAKSFSCIGLDDNWTKIKKTTLSDIYDLRSKIESIKNYSLLKEKKELCCQLEDKYNQFIYEAFKFENDDFTLLDHLESYETAVAELIGICNELDDYLFKTCSSNKELKENIEIIVVTYIELSILLAHLMISLLRKI